MVLTILCSDDLCYLVIYIYIINRDDVFMI